MSKETEELAIAIAEELNERFSIGFSQVFCDTVEWTDVEVKEVAAVIQRCLEEGNKP